ncbi:hypothetical protein C8F01DRAFT_1085760 [Mycena amicta]|nr:hypothetical protein C8F01DRAFT_1085760 [Mycena amicta]
MTFVTLRSSPLATATLNWLAEADAYARIQGISLDAREWMYRHRSPSATAALYLLPGNKLDKIERATRRRQQRLEFAQEASFHGPFSPEDQQQIQERRDARQRQIARRAGTPLALKQRYRPDCCEGCGLPTVPRRECQNPRHLLLSLLGVAAASAAMGSGPTGTPRSVTGSTTIGSTMGPTTGGDDDGGADGQVTNEIASNDGAFEAISDAAKELDGDMSSFLRSGNDTRGLGGGDSTAEEFGG